MERIDRRSVLVALAGGLIALSRTASSAQEPAQETVTAGEDLMREHGVLRRVLVVYDEAIRRLETRQDLPQDVISGGALLVRRFVEDYHERLEEEQVFPRFLRARRKQELVSILLRQNQAGRALIHQIQSLAEGSLDGADWERLATALRSFTRMYRAHAAWEDTELFPALQALVGTTGYRELGERFERRERALFGHDGFPDAVRQVGELEQAMGITGLDAFTPR